MNILLADDHKIVLDGIKAILSDLDGMEICYECDNGQKVLDYLKAQPGSVDLAILDLNMPEIDGIKCTEIIKSNYPKIKVMILTMFNDPVIIREVMNIGADGYLLKNAGKDDFILAVEQISSGEKYFGRHVAASLEKQRKFDASHETIRLTKREKEILRLLADGLNTNEIADKLFLSTYTVATHRKNIMNKFEASNTPGLLKIARSYGFLGSDPFHPR